MELSESEAILFQSLHDSEIGKQLIAYLKRINNILCDIRTLPRDKEEALIALESRRAAEEVINEYLIRMITQTDRKSDADKNEYI